MQYDFYLKEISDIKNGKKYEVLIELPTDIGWINSIDLVIEKGNQKYKFPLKHLKNENDKIYFQNYVHLETSAIYNYYFEINVNEQIKYMGKDKKIVNEINNILKKEEIA